MNRTQEIAWAAGLFEGEGCIHLSKLKTKKVRRRPYPKLSLRMTDLDVVKRFFKIVGYGCLNGPYHRDNPKHKPALDWCWSGRDAIKWALKYFGPYMLRRRLKKLRDVLAREAKFPYVSEGFRRMGMKIRNTKTRCCSKCKQEKKLKFFSTSASWCRQCCTVAGRKYRRRLKAAEEVTVK